MPKSNDTTSRVKFTIGRIRNFKCPQEKSEAKLWDSDVKNLILRARPSGSKAFFYQGRFNTKMLRIKIGNSHDTGITIEYARDKATEYNALINSGIDPRLEIKRSIKNEEKERQNLEKQTVTLQQVWTEYIETNQSGWSELHLKDHYKAMASAGRKRKRSTDKTVAGVLYKLRDQKLGDITPTILLKWINEEKKNRPTVTARGYRLLRACLNWSEGQDQFYGILDLNRLFKNTEIRKALPKPKAKQDALQKTQLTLWFQAVRSIENPVIAAYLQTLLLTGARREEIAGLTWGDVDFQWFSIHIKDKVEGERTIPLTPFLAQLLYNLPRRNKWVFSSPQAQSGRLQDPYKNHSLATASVGLPHISIHGLRRSFGSLSEWVECPIGIVAQIQGHKPSATAEKHYRVRPLDLLRLWHTKIEKQILDFAGIKQPEDKLSNGLKVVA